MPAGLEAPTMAKRMGRPKTSDRSDIAVKIDKATVGKARLIATHRGVSLAEYLSETLRSPVDRHYAQMLRELDQSAKRGAP